MIVVSYRTSAQRTAARPAQTVAERRGAIASQAAYEASIANDPRAPLLAALAAQLWREIQTERTDPR